MGVARFNAETMLLHYLPVVFNIETTGEDDVLGYIIGSPPTASDESCPVLNAKTGQLHFVSVDAIRFDPAWLAEINEAYDRENKV